MSVIASLNFENTQAVVTVHREMTSEGEYVYYTADADIDADGANGQNGFPAAYQLDDNFQECGTDRLENLNLYVDPASHTFHKIHANDGINAILDDQGQPRLFPGGIIASATSLRYPDKALNDPAAYIDAASIPYIAVPSAVVSETDGIVMGCLARVTWNDKSVYCVVADNSRNRIGELSMAAAEALGMSSSPLNGGVDRCEVLYEIWPGREADGFTLQPS